MERRVEIEVPYEKIVHVEKEVEKVVYKDVPVPVQMSNERVVVKEVRKRNIDEAWTTCFSLQLWACMVLGANALVWILPLECCNGRQGGHMHPRKQLIARGCSAHKLASICHLQYAANARM